MPSKDYSNHELKMRSEQSTNENKQKKKGKLHDTNLESVVKLGQFTFCISFSWYKAVERFYFIHLNLSQKTELSRFASFNKNVSGLNFPSPEQ